LLPVCFQNLFLEDPVKLSKRTLDALEPRPRDYFAWDSMLKGFGVRVLPSGRKTYLVQYRQKGRQRRVKIGVHGALTPDQARQRARQILGSVSGGADPAEAKRRARTAPTMNGLANRFLQDHVAVHLKPSTAREYRRIVEKIIRPRFGSLRINDVLRSDVAALHLDLKDTPYLANRTLSVLSKMFNLAELWGIRGEGTNPARLIGKYREKSRERFLKPEELRRLAHVLEASEKDGSESVYVLAAFRLLILTGCRLSEIQTLTWDNVTDGYLVLPDSKTGPRRIPLAPEAEHVLASIPRISGNPYVIAGDIPGTHVYTLQKPWRRIRIRADLPSVRIHDLRHTYASMAVSSGLSLPILAKLLGHTQMQTTQRYAHLMDAPVQEGAQAVGAALGKALKVAPIAPRLKIVPSTTD
jgi:integrase